MSSRPNFIVKAGPIGCWADMLLVSWAARVHQASDIFYPRYLSPAQVNDVDALLNAAVLRRWRIES